jgi:hypothetical protein
VECDALTAICDDTGRKVLDVANFGGSVVLGIPGVDRVACVDVGDLMDALERVGILAVDVETTDWRGNRDAN